MNKTVFMYRGPYRKEEMFKQCMAWWLYNFRKRYICEHEV